MGTFRLEDLVEACHVLRVAIADDELDVDYGINEVTGYVPCLLGDPGPLGWAVPNMSLVTAWSSV